VSLSTPAVVVRATRAAYRVPVPLHPTAVAVCQTATSTPAAVWTPVLQDSTPSSCAVNRVRRVVEPVISREHVRRVIGQEFRMTSTASPVVTTAYSRQQIAVSATMSNVCLCLLVIYIVQPHWQVIQPASPRIQRTVVHEKAHPVVYDVYSSRLECIDAGSVHRLLV